MRLAMTYQSASIGLGIFIGFFLGGLASNNMGLRGNAVLGTVASAVNVVSLIYFIVAPPNENENVCSIGDSLVELTQDQVAEATGEPFRFRKTAILDRLRGAGEQRDLMAAYSESEDVVPSRFQYMVGAIFSFEAMATACIYSVGPLYILDTSGVSKGNTSLVMSAASLLGSILTFLIISSR